MPSRDESSCQHDRHAGRFGPCGGLSRSSEVLARVGVDPPLVRASHRRCLRLVVPRRTPWRTDRGCKTSNGLTLYYTGISPKKPPTNGKPPSSQTIRHRIRTHYSGNAEGSTLRRTLGCLLQNGLGIELRRYGSGKRYTFGTGERDLSQWMAANAYVSWIGHDTPWEVEDRLIEHLNVPLNLDGNTHNSFYPALKVIRAAAVAHANSLPVLANPGVGGR